MKPKQRVILYRHGIKPEPKHVKRNEQYGKYNGIESQCPRCLRFLKYPENNHKSDPVNKIPCIERI